MISKNQIKLIRSLAIKKFRDEEGLFMAEGKKLVADLLSVFTPHALFAVKDFEDNFLNNFDFEEITEKELRQISNMNAPQGVLAVFRKPEFSFLENDVTEHLTLALDDIQDPGNLGTIIRIADWFGISQVFCSPHTADIFNPKVIQATMGAIARVKVHYVDLQPFIENYSKKVPVYGTFLSGENIYDENLSKNGIIIMGNEGNGISPEIEKLVSKRLFIPNFPNGNITSESLNVSVSTALVCAEFRRRT